ncbi:701_t:CDS:2, partial [Funneliformis geosporum]
DEVNNAIRIASKNAKEFSNLFQMKKQSKNNNCINSLLSKPSKTNKTNNQIANEVSQSITIDQNNELDYNESKDLLEINITEVESISQESINDELEKNI